MSSNHAHSSHKHSGAAAMKTKASKSKNKTKNKPDNVDSFSKIDVSKNSKDLSLQSNATGDHLHLRIFDSDKGNKHKSLDNKKYSVDSSKNNFEQQKMVSTQAKKQVFSISTQTTSQLKLQIDKLFSRKLITARKVDIHLHGTNHHSDTAITGKLDQRKYSNVSDMSFSSDTTLVDYNHKDNEFFNEDYMNKADIRMSIEDLTNWSFALENTNDDITGKNKNKNYSPKNDKLKFGTNVLFDIRLNKFTDLEKRKIKIMIALVNRLENA